MSAAADELRMRAAQRADLETLAVFEAGASATPWSPGQIADSLDRHQVLLVECAGQMLGYAVFRELLDEAELLHIVVAPQLRRQGIGRSLLRALRAALAPAVRCLHLEVRAGNAPAIALYQGEGFVPIGRRRGYYLAVDGREDALLLRLDLC
ncbi:MAG: ribosomal protein S18-alanine N-acetyltransferase [Pseudomonadales bacterium]|nr:ribosomal protein S18-alanine N-acetyltransferase [Pseudomonadales bacterium]